MKATITIPEDLSEITLGQYQSFLSASKGLEGDELAQCTVSSLCGVRINEVANIKLSDVRDISEHLNMLFSVEQDIQVRFKLEGVDFGFIPSLESITFGEYVDLDKYSTDWEEMHKAMAVLYRPVTNTYKDKYEVRDYDGTEEYAEIMKFMPLNVAMGSLVFFYRLGNELLKATHNYLKQELKEMITANKHNLTDNGDGIIQSMHSQMEILESSEMLQKLELPKHLIF